VSKAATWLQLAIHHSLLVVAIFINKAASLRLRCSNAGASRAAAATWPLEQRARRGRRITGLGVVIVLLHLARMERGELLVVIGLLGGGGNQRRERTLGLLA
jgi:hypothetical protein